MGHQGVGASVMLDPAQLPARQRDFYELWTRIRGDRRMPSRAEFPFHELAPWLEGLHLVEVLPDGDFLFRVFATKSAMRLDAEYTGRRFSELPRSWILQDALLDYRRVAATGEPLFTDRTRRQEDGRMYSWRRLIMPVGDDGRTVDHLFVCLDYDYE